MEYPRRAFLRRSAAIAGTAAVMPMALTDPAQAETGPVNIRVSQDGFDMHGEPSLAANPRDPRNLLGTCIVFDQDLAQGSLATYASFDGGRTWHGNGTLPGISTVAIDPSVDFDADGHGYVCGPVGSRQQSRGTGVRVWRTDDGGRTFPPPVTAIPGYTDHPSLAADRWSIRQPGTVYVAAALNPGLVFTRSLDGGRGFAPPRVLDPQAAGPVVAAGPDGLVCIAYPAPVPPLSSGNAMIRATVSADHGATFGVPADLIQVFVQPYFNLPAVAVAPRGGTVHLAVATYDSTSHRSELLLFGSGDRGRTWATPVRLASSDRAVYLQPELAIDENDRIAVSVFADSQGQVDVLLFIGEHHPPRFGPPVRVTSRPFDSSLGAGGHWIGDYQGLAAAQGAFHPFWNDTRTGRLEIFTAIVRCP